MATEEQQKRLEDIMGWVSTAKENLPSINDGFVAPDRIAEASALLDRLHRLAIALRDRMAAETGRRAA